MADSKFGRTAVAASRCVGCMGKCDAYVCIDCCFNWSRNDEHPSQRGASPTQQGRAQNRSHEVLRGYLALKRNDSPQRAFEALRPQREVSVSDCLDCPWLREDKAGYICGEAARKLEIKPWQGPPEWCALRTGTQLVFFRFKSKDT